MRENFKIESPDSSENEKYSHTWRVVEISRHPQRPYTLDYVDDIFFEYELLSGDRLCAEDAAMICGIGAIHTHPKKSPLRICFIGHQKGRSTQQKILRNFGMAKPEGYRKAMRLMDVAERFQMPLLTFIDTPGAFPGVEAEKRGQFSAIAECTLKMLDLSVPTVSVVIGEGGSGGALAIGVPDRLLMLKNSTYSVISPESCASILWGDPKRAKQAAASLKFTSKDLLRLGICDELIEEPDEGAHSNFRETADAIKNAVINNLQALSKLSKENRLKKRYDKYRHLDQKLIT